MNSSPAFWLLNLLALTVVAAETNPPVAVTNPPIAVTNPPVATTNQPLPFGHARGDLASFQVKRGFRLELVAAEPLVVSPVAMAFDENGRLFVAEARDLANRDAASGTVRVLEDTDGDGVFDAGSIYAENLAWPSALACYNGGVFVAVTPEIIYLKDSAGDRVADVRQVVFSGFGGQPEQMSFDSLVNSFSWGLDQRIYGATAGISGVVNALRSAISAQLELRGNDFSFDPRASTIYLESGPAQSGLSFDSRGRKFMTDFTRPLKLPLSEPRYTDRNPYFPKGPVTTNVPGASAPIFRFSSRLAGTIPTTNMIISVPPLRAKGTTIYRGSLYPATYSENVFFGDATAGVVHRLVLRENPLLAAAERAGDELNTEFLMARNITFQPTHLINGPEGALYIADYYKGGDSGRIYRIVPEKFQLRKPPPLGKVPTPELVAMLAQTNGWHRDTAARLLYERQDAASVPLLTSMIQNSRLVLARVHALYLLANQGALREDLVLRALRDPDERLREHGLLLTERLLRDGAISDTVWNQLKMMPGDRSMRVVHQLALTLGEIRRSDRSQLLADILRRTYAIPMMQTAVLSSLNEGAGQVFVSLASDARVRNDPGAQPVLQQLLTMIGVKGREEEIAPVLDFVDRARLDPQQSFTMLHVLGEGLRRIGASFPVVDRNNRLQRFYDDSVLATLNDALPQPVRLAAIRFRGVSPYVATGTGDFFQLLFDPGAAQSEAVQVAAITTLGRYNNPNVPINFISRWQSLSPALRNEALAALLSRDDAVPLVVSAVQRGTIRLNEFSSVQMDFLRTYSDPAISQAAVNLFGPVAGERPGRWSGLSRLYGLPGLPREGDKLFWRAVRVAIN